MFPDLRKNKDVHCLGAKVFTVEEAIKEYKRQLQSIPTHNYKMARQWEALARAKASLKPGELITEEDYQVCTAASGPVSGRTGVCKLGCVYLTQIPRNHCSTTTMALYAIYETTANKIRIRLWKYCLATRLLPS